MPSRGARGRRRSTTRRPSWSGRTSFPKTASPACDTSDEIGVDPSGWKYTVPVETAQCSAYRRRPSGPHVDGTPRSHPDIRWEPAIRNKTRLTVASYFVEIAFRSPFDALIIRRMSFAERYPVATCPSGKTREGVPLTPNRFPSSRFFSIGCRQG